MTITHIVSFRYAETVDQATRQSVFQRFLDLRSLCKLQDGSAYIADVIAGNANISPEGAGKGFDHTFIVTFNNADHVKHYLETDAAHLDFAAFVKPLLVDAFIYDFHTQRASA
ncbi:Stress responsive alpha-beta barrel [Ceraceosorus bombacis]|uniref:Stress responsive alpha-beta barrel n=1 Tax=Ceraceosorus bombacis TaxID=401625 RepID=A0A0P1BB53_9BASI|nr:Stress responsive alpha-beta barrel [Ceraceosorus bombacis]